MMKKDRNSFFSQFGSYGYNSPQVAPMMPAQQGFYMPEQQMSSNMSYQVSQPPVYSDASDIDARLSKIERELNRLDARLNKLETASITSVNSNTANTDYNFANSMYMV